MSYALRNTALYLQYTAPTPPAASARGPQVIWIMALLLCVLGSIDPALLWLLS